MKRLFRFNFVMTKEAGRTFARHFAGVVRQLLFPKLPPCPGCFQQRPGPSGSLCQPCRRRAVPVVPPICRRCGRPLRGGGKFICLACRQTVRYFHIARAPFVYEGATKDYVRRFKYGGERKLGAALAMSLTAYVVQRAELWPIDVVIPLPLHRHRLEQRGFNQAELLARPLAANIGRRLCPDVLQRRKATTTQSRLSAVARRDNVRDAFFVEVPAKVAGKRVLLIDDVLTSGATADEAARTLLRAGAVAVNVACAAIALYDKDWEERGKSYPDEIASQVATKLGRSC